VNVKFFLDLLHNPKRNYKVLSRSKRTYKVLNLTVFLYTFFFVMCLGFPGKIFPVALDMVWSIRCA